MKNKITSLENCPEKIGENFDLNRIEKPNIQDKISFLRGKAKTLVKSTSSTSKLK